MVQPMLKHILPILGLAVSLGMSSCSETRRDQLAVEANNEAPQEAKAPPVMPAPPPPAPPGFDEAMQTHKPLGKVTGAAEPFSLKVDLADGKFSEALNYAAQKSSYAFLVWHKGAIRHETYFAPHDATLRPDSASMHKSVTGLAVGAALDKGIIKSIDETIGTYIPEWKDQPRGNITIRNLLEMNSGLAPLSSEGGMNSPAMTFWMQGDKARGLMMGMELRDEPGTVFNYANAVTQILGLILERASDQPYEDFLSDHIWTPLGAEDAYVWYNEADGFPRTYSSLMAPARDWMKLGLLIKDGGKFNGKQIVSEDYIKKMVSPSATNPSYGWQIWLGTAYEPVRFYNEIKVGLSVAASAPFKADDMIYFDGFGGQRVYISPSNDLVIVRTGDPAFDWDESFLPNSVLDDLSAD